MKLLSYNLGYMLGREGSFGGYLPSIRDMFAGNPDAERRSFHQLTDLIERETPDLVSMLEVDHGSSRTHTSGQMQRLRGRLSARGLDYDAASFGKYDPNWILAHLPYYRHFGNGVLTANTRETEAIYLEHGIKRLVIAVRLAPDLVVFVLHLSLGERSRRRQLRELAGVIQQHAADASVVLLGDFNILNGAGELDALLDTTGLELWEPGPTIAPRPLDDFVLSTRCLDVFCCSPELSVERCDVLDVSFSDHKPVLLEVSL